MVEYKKKFPSGEYVFKCWDTEVEEVDNKLVKSIVSTFADNNLCAGVVCATFKNGDIIAFTQMNNEHDYEHDMAVSLRLEHYEIAYFVKKFWESRKKNTATK